MNAKELTQLLTAVLMCVFGCGLLIAGFTVPPLGVIDPSVLVAFGEILTFVGSLVGVDYHYRYRSPRPPEDGTHNANPKGVGD